MIIIASDKLVYEVEEALLVYGDGTFKPVFSGELELLYTKSVDDGGIRPQRARVRLTGIPDSELENAVGLLASIVVTREYLDMNSNTGGLKVVTSHDLCVMSVLGISRDAPVIKISFFEDYTKTLGELLITGELTEGL